MNKNELPLPPAPSSRNSSGLSLRSKVFIGLLLFSMIAVGVYFYYLKDKIISLSEAKLSALLGVDLSYEHYRFLAPGTLEVTGLKIQAPYPKSKYAEVNKFQREWYSFTIRKITLHDFNYKDFVNNRYLKASHIEMDSVEVDLYRDKRLPRAPIVKTPLMASLLRKIKYKIQLDHIHMNNTNIRYYEQTEHADEHGMISFKDSKVVLDNVTNLPEYLKKNPIMTCDIQSTVLGAAKLTGKVLFDLNSKSDKFTLTGSSKSFQAEKLNRIISGVLPAALSEGQIHGMKFRIDGDDDQATGYIDMEYEGVKIKVFDKNDNKFKSFMSSLVVNSFVRNDNLSSKKNYKRGKINYKRVKKGSMFNYWWKCLRSGILDVMITDTGKLLNLDDKAQLN